MTRTPQVITAELRRWIVDQAEAGCRPQEIIAAMRTAGWEESLAAEAMEHTLRERLQELDRRTAESVPASAVPEPDLSAAPTVLQVAGHEVRVLLTLRHPRVVVLGGFLTDDECTQLMALAAPRLARSENGRQRTGGSEVNAARTSDGMFFERGEHGARQVIEARIADAAALAGGPWRGHAGAALPARRRIPSAPRLLRPCPPRHGPRAGSAAASAWARW
jgi:prolyl 4-hydroxylase